MKVQPQSANYAPSASARAPNLTARRVNPALIWAGIGALLLTLEFYILGSWVLSARFVPTGPGVAMPRP